MKKAKPSYISFGGGLRLLDEDYFIEELKGFIRSRRGFRGLCRAIGCPLIFVDQGKAFVDPVTFQICMKSITRAGAQDFAMPGAKSKNGKRTNLPYCRVSIPPEEIRTNWRWLVGELLAGKRLAKIGTPAQVKRAMLDLTTRLAELSYSTLPTVIAEEYDLSIARARLPEDPDNATRRNPVTHTEEANSIQHGASWRKTRRARSAKAIEPCASSAVED